MSFTQPKLLPHCDNCLLSGYLDAELTAEEQDWVEGHVGQCSECLQKMEYLAADKEFWTTAIVALETGIALEAPSRPIADLSLDALSSRTSETEFSQTQMLHRWLDPSKRPDSLGRIGKYEVLAVAGLGGMGLVLKAYDTELNRNVALKTMSHHVTARADARSRLAREARAVAAIHHPNVISIFGLETWRDVPLIVMPFVEGGTLQQFATEQRLDTEQVIRSAVQIAAALTALHASGIVHRDLKPSNILLQEGLDHLLLSDFGLARIDGDESITHTDAMAGTPYFMSPEQALGKKINMKSDLFSFGSVLYWLCTGKYPFRGDSNYETLTQLVHAPLDCSPLVRKKVPNCLQRVIHGLCAKDPNERWTSSEQVGVLLQACLEHSRTPSYPLPPELAQPKRSKSNSTNWLNRIAVALILSMIAGLGLWWSSINGNLWKKSGSSAIASLDQETGGQPELGKHQKLEDPPEHRPFSSKSERTRYGALDDLDRKVMLDELKAAENHHYWLRRLAYLSVEEIPAEALPQVQLLCNHSDPTTRELSQVILNKNPFQEVLLPNSPHLNTETLESPFQEVLKNE